MSSTNTPRFNFSRERIFLLLLSAIVIVSRLWAIPASLWEWDDILFARSLHKFDLVAHSPHPPGFPVFVALGRVAYAILGNEHFALVAVNVFFSSFLAIALYYLYREITGDRVIAGIGALLCCFAPNVWLHSASPRSDSAAFVLGVAALAFAITSLRRPGNLIIASLIFGLGMGVRVTLLPVVAPTLTVVCLIYLWRRQWKLVAGAVITTALAVLVWFVPLIVHTTWATYRSVMRAHADFTYTTDGMFAPTENAFLAYRFTRFAIDIWGTRSIAIGMYVLSAIGVVSLLLSRKSRSLAWMVLAFVPYICFVFILNTPLSAPLYSLPYIPFFAGLAACGVVLSVRLILRSRPYRVQTAISVAIGCLFVLWLIIWTFPVIKMVRSEESPPVRAMRYLRNTMRADRDVLHYDGYFSPHVDFFLHEYKAVMSDASAESASNLLSLALGSPNIYTVSTTPTITGGDAPLDSKTFKWSRRRPSERLKALSLGRYFNVYTANLGKRQEAAYLDGWYDLESNGSEGWRWTRKQARTAVLNTNTEMTLHVRFQAAGSNANGPGPVVTIRLDSHEIEKLSANGLIERTYTITPDGSRLWSVLTFETSDVRVPSHISASSDSRELGLQFFTLDWSSKPGARPLITRDDQFLGTGWYPVEAEGAKSWRWMQANGTVQLPPIDGDAELIVTMLVPTSADEKQSEVTIDVGTNRLDRFSPPSRDVFTRTYRVPASIASQPMELRLSAVPVSRPGDDRSLAICVYGIDWHPVR